MSKVLVLYYSSYGHVETMADAIARGARAVAGADVVVKRVPELVPTEIAAKAGHKLDQAAPEATVQELVDYDATIFGTPTRFGNMSAQIVELALARFQGQHVTQITAALVRGRTAA